jgi:trehalose 6-phosphate synthase/phosphatase
MVRPHPQFFQVVSLTLIANRSPVRLTPEGWGSSLGGLATALLPIMEQRGGTWVAMREPGSDEPLEQPFPEDDPRITVRRVPLTEDEFEGYYQGMANRVLWPLMHYLIEQVEADRELWHSYERVNTRFAEAALKDSPEDSRFWVHDYHMMLVPALIRQARPDARIGHFWHIPWPAAEVYRILPAAKPLLEGMLGADLIGFHTEGYAENFRESARDLLGARVEGTVVHWQGRRVHAIACPLGIDIEFFSGLAEDPHVQSEAHVFRDEIHVEKLVVGVDRLDYTKGLLLRLDAFQRFLVSHPEWHKRVSLLQVATPSRTGIEAYDRLKREVDEMIGRINGQFAEGAWTPIQYRYRSYTQEELAILYRSADVALITPLRDGMNLVAQEFAATSDNGVLVLSELTGAADYLDGALLANPYDTEGLPDALHEALMMEPNERAARLARLRTAVAKLDSHDWADRFLKALDTEESPPTSTRRQRQPPRLVTT